jgi:hypothetical protein
MLKMEYVFVLMLTVIGQEEDVLHAVDTGMTGSACIERLIEVDQTLQHILGTEYILSCEIDYAGLD